MTKRSFRRWFAVALLVVLPLQSMWAAAAAYCTHQDGSSPHFGHHEHRHAGAKSVDAPSADASATTGGGDVDCAACHLVCAQIVPTGAGSLAAPPPRDWSLHRQPDPGVLVRSAIDRPNWARLA